MILESSKHSGLKTKNAYPEIFGVCVLPQEAIVVPDVGSLHKNILFTCHDVFYSGHMDITKTLK